MSLQTLSMLVVVCAFSLVSPLLQREQPPSQPVGQVLDDVPVAMMTRELVYYSKGHSVAVMVVQSTVMLDRSQDLVRDIVFRSFSEENLSNRWRYHLRNRSH